ncbi:class I SAM-dependent methyltransferase [Aureimonas flava]|uniref:Class I SAM-dependent methyltransferase n=1 Tax=Aureimonas flava TaxID=2320271 RepID=A0A3A1WXS1_9HYPH|nr:cyclopropane-fatty-acyl-phospholipid synthase family protein [Aureimonas flava]RIY03519.1 class I SAM-dependent methyltransferase [Aureimonas flava]
MYPLLAFYCRRLFRRGRLEVRTADGTVHRFGDGGQPAVAVRLASHQAERAIAHDPALALGECYMNGELELAEGSIMDLVRLACENAGVHATSELWMRLIVRARGLVRRFRQNNVPTRSRRNVQHHYDLSRELYALFLDPDLQYSCAYFEHPQQSLAEAQLAKKRHIAAKLNLDREGLDVLDIGSGWGGLGLYLARTAGARVTGVTLSDEQLALSRERVEADGLASRVNFRLQDYRHITETFDRIVSVGMFEHVGREFYAAFFGRAAELLRPEGVMLLHTIGRSTEPADTNAFIQRHIFPGGYTPSLSEMLPAIERAGLIVTDVEVLRLHYAETCRLWREAFIARREAALSLHDERFCRMWEFYLAIAEAGFRWQGLVVFQIQLARRTEALPITRDYMAQNEARLRDREAATDDGRLRPALEAAG